MKQTRNKRVQSKPKKSKPESSDLFMGITALVGGAALGTLAMYVLDPSQGAQRRAAAREAARRTFENTAEAIRDRLDNASEKAAEISSTAYESLPSSDRFRESGQRVLDKTRNLGSSLRDAARGWLPQIERHSDYAMNPMGVFLTALGALGLGLGAMWMLDPRLGRGRRDWLLHKSADAIEEAVGGDHDEQTDTPSPRADTTLPL